MVLKYYYDLLSQPSRAVYIFLKMNKIPFEPAVVNLGGGEHLTEEFREKHSKFQKVPFIHHDDFRLTESVAIVRYLAREYHVKEHWYPQEIRAQARVDEYLEWNHLNVRAGCARYFFDKLMGPMMTGKQPSDEQVKKNQKAMEKTLTDFERIFLSSEAPFITGTEISFADLQAACEIEQPRLAGYEPRDHFSKIKTWLENVKSECQPYYDEAHKPLEAWLKKIQKKAAKL
ncbi:unnamed protein product [Callosobruchus maculatus]|uniref:glutathione transferase n=1 Tax=Callosobruchus maculatus TaxID=64391 RepID=A0A653CWN8_CALMS|nr:unnamed protein product [Callosobruchus maculatus]